MEGSILPSNNGSLTDNYVNYWITHNSIAFEIAWLNRSKKIYFLPNVFTTRKLCVSNLLPIVFFQNRTVNKMAEGGSTSKGFAKVLAKRVVRTKEKASLTNLWSINGIYISKYYFWLMWNVLQYLNFLYLLLVFLKFTTRIIWQQISNHYDYVI